MSDLTKRLRSIAVKGGDLETVVACMDAADAIEQLEHELALHAKDKQGLGRRLEAALALLREVRDAEQCLGVNETLIARIDAAMKERK